MSVPKSFSKIIIDKNDKKYNILKEILIKELSDTFVNENYDEVIDFIFETITKPDISMSTIESSFKIAFQDEATNFLDTVIKNANEIYENSNVLKNNKQETSDDMDLLDEINEAKASKINNENKQNIKQNYNNKKTGESSKFNIGGKTIVLKNKHTNNDDKNDFKRERSRDKEIQYSKQSFNSKQYSNNNFRNNDFSIPRGFIRGNFSRFPRPSIRLGGYKQSSYIKNSTE